MSFIPPSSKIFALVDCNNFYASCERVFKPSLQNKPIVVLSSNDGCIIARSSEAKALNIPMGAPFYQAREICKKNNVAVFSANFQLYGDMSHRVMQTLSTFSPDFEIYSVDEAFLRLDGFENPLLHAEKISQTVPRWTGVPVSIGLGPTKTLAKVANDAAKKNKISVLNLLTPQAQNEVLSKTKLRDVWGLGEKLSNQLTRMGFQNAKEIRDAEPSFLRKHFSIVMERLVYELRGVSCLNLEEVSPQHHIMTSRSFGKKVKTIEELNEALSCFAFRAAQKLRIQNQKARGMYVFIRTNKFNMNSPQYKNSHFENLEIPTNDTGDIIKAGQKILKDHLYKKGFLYQKLGLILTDLVSNKTTQTHLFEKKDFSKSENLMKALDSINKNFGQKGLFYASQGIERKWQALSDHRSPRYTTSWNELLEVR